MVRMGNTGAVFTIGELAKRTGLPVKTIRFYSDEGLLPRTDRTHSGYRLYDIKAMARLELVKTLRGLGLGLRRRRARFDTRSERPGDREPARRRAAPAAPVATSGAASGRQAGIRTGGSETDEQAGVDVRRRPQTFARRVLGRNDRLSRGRLGVLHPDALRQARAARTTRRPSSWRPGSSSRSWCRTRRSAH